MHAALRSIAILRCGLFSHAFTRETILDREKKDVLGAEYLELVTRSPFTADDTTVRAKALS